jgi:hypothetical protein
MTQGPQARANRRQQEGEGQRPAAEGEEQRRQGGTLGPACDQQVGGEQRGRDQHERQFG